jgi:MFS family permease
MASNDSTASPVSCSPAESARSLHGLDWLNFFLADIRTGVGPFVAVYLTNLHWNVQQIGVALTAAEIAGVLTQVPGGGLMDYTRSKRMMIALNIALLSIGSLLFALYPKWLVVMGAQIALGVTGSIFVAGIASITLGLVGYTCLGARTGRNAGFAAAGNVIAAVTMGIIGYRYSTRAIFFFVALLSIPTLLSVFTIRGNDIDYERARGREKDSPEAETTAGLRTIFSDHRMLVFAVLTLFWHLGNGAMLAMIGETIARDRPQQAPLWMSAAVTVPQLIMAAIAPVVGKIADAHGRKQILLFGFVFLPIRTLLCAGTQDPTLLIGYQLLDGISAGIFNIVSVLVVADLSRGTGHYNLALGTIGAAIGIGASISTLMAGSVTHHLGFPAGFLALSAAAIIAVLILAFFMPETRDAGAHEVHPAVGV